MSEERNAAPMDMVRLTFTSHPLHRNEIENHLADQGCDVLVRDDSQFLVTWDEPARDVDEVIEEVWALNGEPFEVTLEEFQRLSLLSVFYEEHAAVETEA